MKLLAPIVFAAGALAFSVDMRPRHLIARQATADLATDIEAITAATKDLGTAIQGFGSSTSALDVNGKASAVTDAINHGIIDAGDVQQIDQNDALSLANPVQELSKATEATIQTLISKKSAFVQAGLGDAVLQTLKQQQTASNKFSAALLSKLPPALQGPASNLAKPAADAINMGIVAYSSGTTPSSSSSAAAAPAPTTSTQAAVPVAQTTSTEAAAPTTTSTQAAPTTTMAAQTTTQAAPMAPQAPNTMPVVQISDGQIQAHPTTYGSFQGSFASQMPTTYGSYIPAASSAPYSYSYSKPGSTPSGVSPAAARYSGAAAPKAIVGFGAYAAVAMVAVAAL